MERDKIPLHNEKYSRINDVYHKNTQIIRNGFFNNTLPTPSHVILNHINSWETMLPIAGPQSAAASRKDSMTSPTLPEERSGRKSLELPKATVQTVEDEADGQTKAESEQPQQGLTVISMTQRLNRSKFLTTVYYKPSTNKFWKYMINKMIFIYI